MSDLRIGVRMEMVKVIDEADKEIAKLNVELAKDYEVLGRLETNVPPVIEEQINWKRQDINNLKERVAALTLRRSVFAVELGM